MLEDNVPQPSRTFSMGEAPIMVCMVIEFSNRFELLSELDVGTRPSKLCTASSRHYSPKILWPSWRTTFGRKSFRTFRPTSDKEIHQALRNQYSIAYSLTTSHLTATFARS